MADKILESYKDAIQNTFHDVIDITYPAHRGQQNTMLFVKTADGDYATKFNTSNMVLKNHYVSHVAAQNGILTPDISIAGHKGVWFEHYPLLHGKTLFERMNDGMPTHAVKRAFDEILVQFMRMGNLPVKTLRPYKCLNVHETAYEHTKNTHGPALAYTLMAIVYLMNRGKQKNIGLYHCDISPKNVIVDENGKLISFLDMDSMAISNRDYAFGAMADHWARIGFDSNELYDKYEHMTGCKLNRMRINTMANMLNFGKYIMFHTNKNKIK